MTIQNFQLAGHFLISSVYLEATMVETGKIFQKKRSQMDEKCYF